MTLNVSSVDALSSELEGQVQKIEDSCSVISSELTKGPPIDVARVHGEVLKVTHLRGQFFAYFQRLTQAQRDATLRQQQEDGGRGVLPVVWQRLGTRAGHVRVWLNQWPVVQSVVKDILEVRRRKLYLKPAELGGVHQAQIDTADMLFSRLGGILNPGVQSDEARDIGCFKDIGYPMTAFLEHMHAAHRVMLAKGRTSGVSFLDVGCGGGIKVLAAQRFFDHSSGLEFDRNYVRRARRLLRDAGQGGGRIIQADGTKYRKYSDFDVVFLFRPMSDGGMLKLLEQQVVDNVRPGSLIIAPYKGFANQAADRGCPSIDGGLFLAKSPKSEAVRLRRRAEYMGNHVGRHRSKFPGLFDPILKAAADNGFAHEERNALLDL